MGVRGSVPKKVHHPNTGRKILKSALFKVVNREQCKYCGQTRITYRRWLHPEMALFLVQLTRLGRGIHHTREIYPKAAKASTDAAYLTHWGLVSRHGKGEYEITLSGTLFVDNFLKVPAWIDLRAGLVVKVAKENIMMADFKKA